MSQDTHERVRQLLRLTPLVEDSIPFDEFIMSLAEHPERADSAFAVVHRAILWMGVENPDQEPDPERRQYLKMLAELDVPSLNAFKHVAGNQRFALGPMQFLKSASGNGADARKMLIIEGGSGAGKDFFRDGIIRALERYTDEVEKLYAVEGCPFHENPVNLLKLLKREQLESLAEATGLGKKLFQLVDQACEPCQHCNDKILGTVDKPKTEPSFDDVKVVPMRLTARAAGIAEWKPGDTSTLAGALNKANRGFLSMPDAFIERKPKEGETDERLLLMTAPEYKRLPGQPTEDGRPTAHSPMDVFILCTTNKNAWEKFLDEVVPDKEAFTGRCVIVRLPYNLIRCEEVRTYRKEMDSYKEKAEFDPLVLHVLATLAVVSRFPVPESGQPFVDPIDRLRLYQGEQILVKARSGTEWNKVWGTSESSSYGGFGGGYGGWGSESRRPSSGSSSRSEDDPEAAAFRLPTDVPISTGLLWSVIDPREGRDGLDMRYMLSLLSRLNTAGLAEQKKSKDKKEKEPTHGACINSLMVLRMLRGEMARKSKAGNLTDEQKAVYQRCLKWLGGEPRPYEEPSVDRPPLIEGEFRRLLRNLLLQVFAPDYEERAQQAFNDYRLHAPAAFEGKSTVKDPKMGQVPVNNRLLDELDRYRLDKSKDAFLSDDDKKFRGQLDAYIGQLRDEHVEQFGPESAKDFKVNWQTIPELARAIRAKLDTEIGQLIEKLITTEVKSDLKEFEQQQLERAEKKLEELGFTKACRKPILEYAKRTKVWSYQATN